MNQQQREDLILYLEALETTIKGQDTTQILSAQKYLEGVAKTDKYFLQNILKIVVNSVQDQCQYIEQPIRQQAMLQASMYVRAFLNDVNQNTNEILFGEYSQLVIQIFQDDELSLSNLKILQQLLIDLLQFDKNGHVKNLVSEQICQTIGQEGFSIKQQNHMIVALGCIYQETKLPSELHNLYQATNDAFLRQINILVNDLNNQINVMKEIYQEQNQQQNLQDIQDQEKIMITTLKGITEWCNCFNSIYKKFVSKQSMEWKALIYMLIQNKQLASTCVQLLGLQFMNNNQLQNCIISCSQVKIFDQQMNIIKTKVLKIYKKIVRFTISNEGKFDLNNCAFYSGLSQILPTFIQTPILYLNTLPRNVMEKQLIEKDMSVLLPQIFSFIGIVVTEKQYQKFYEQNYKQLILDAIFPMLRTTLREQQLIYDDPQEFISLSLDTVDQHLSSNGKCDAAKLLETLADNIDGAATFIIQICCSIIERNMINIQQEQQQQNIQAQFTLIEKFTDSIFLNHSDAVEQIDTSLLSIAILSYIFAQARPDLIQPVQQIISTYQSHFFSEDLSSLIKVRFIQVLGGMHDFLFRKKTESSEYENILHYMVQCVQAKAIKSEQEGQEQIIQKKNKERKLINLIALAQLEDMYESPQITDKMIKILVKNFGLLTRGVLTSNLSEYFNFIQQVIINFGVQIKNYPIIIQTLMEDTCKKMNKQINKIQNFEGTKQQKKKKKHILLKCFSLVETIVEQKEFSEMLPNLETYIVQIGTLLENYKEDYFSDIVTILIKYIRKQQSINQNLINLVKYFDKCMEHRSYVMHDMVQLLNLYIHYGYQFIQNSPESVKAIVDICFKVMNTQRQNSTDADKAEGAIIMHNIIENMGDTFDQQTWSYILEKTYQTLQIMDQKQDTIDFFYGRVVGIILICFMVNYDQVMQIIVNTNMLQQTIQYVTIKGEYFRHTYDTKVFILGMTNLAIRQNLPELLQEAYPKIFYTIVVLLQNQSVQEEALKLRQEQDRKVIEKNNQQKRKQIGDEDLEELGDDSNIYNQVQPNIKYIFPPPYDLEDDDTPVDVIQDDETLRKMLCKVTFMDEFQFFKERIINLKQQNQQLCQNLIQTLDQDCQNYLQNLLNIQRVQIQGQNNTKTVTARKIVKVRRNNN